MTSESGTASFRPATAADSEAVAALHVASWRDNYRGSLSDAYLDGPIETERRRVWRELLDHPRAGQIVVLAEIQDALTGFICAFADHDERWGTLIDNLHVAATAKGRGLGRQLMGRLARHLIHIQSRRPVHLYVLDANHAARAFYGRIGGEPVEQGRKIEPDGSECAVIRYVWGAPDYLAEMTGA